MAGEAPSAKRALRVRLARSRDMIDLRVRAQSDAKIARALIEDDIWRRARIIYIYLDFGAEVATHAIIERAWDAGKRVCVPRCDSLSMALSWHEIGSFEGLERSAFGMLEPAPGAPVAAGRGQVAGGRLAVVPGLAFDAYGYRLGYGGGCYDRFLRGFDGVSVGLSRRDQLLASLAEQGVVEDHDVPVGFIVTERGVIAARPMRGDL